MFRYVILRLTEWGNVVTTSREEERLCLPGNGPDVVAAAVSKTFGPGRYVAYVWPETWQPEPGHFRLIECRGQVKGRMLEVRLDDYWRQWSGRQCGYATATGDPRRDFDQWLARQVSYRTVFYSGNDGSGGLPGARRNADYSLAGDFRAAGYSYREAAAAVFTDWQNLKPEEQRQRLAHIKSALKNRRRRAQRSKAAQSEK